MKKLAIMFALLAAAGVAQAEGVSLYGILDAGVRYDDSANSSNQAAVKMASGVQQTSRFGVRGSENLDDNSWAKFQLESGINVNNGTSSQQSASGSVLFDRFAWVGVSDRKLGEVQLGRNTNVTYDFAAQGITDPLATALEGLGTPVVTGSTAARINQAITVVGATNSFATTRSDNMIKYINSLGPVTVEGGYSLGGTTNDLSPKSSWNLGAKTTLSGITAAVATFQAKDASKHQLNTYSAGVTGAVDAVTLTAGYHKLETDVGYSPANLTTVATSQTLLGGVSGTNARVYNLGAKYQLTANVSSTLAYYNGNYKNTTANGKLDTYVLWNQYNLSKHTNLYLELDYARAKDGMVTTGDAANNFGTTVGMRHIF